ncbi:MAG: Jag N-terminal domain-containing protein [Desulfotignum sp.]|nr:Jag N-terminal domain-containing protein [Desulfotignum sp.]MCF8089255.1 Jag N-terminal domain-containing protein [Desulfotignum sp.]MCF8138787.1 Jag N-terminal domain-containing protein [Desulfotignum sp.]
MKKTQEFSGKDVDTAVKTACDTLSISKKELKYDVISTGASGIFGIVGRKDAVIKVILPQNSADSSEKELEGIRSMVDEAFGQETRVSPPPSKEKSSAAGSETPVKPPPPPARNKPAPLPKKQEQPRPVESTPKRSTDHPAPASEEPAAPASAPASQATEPAPEKETASPEPPPVVDVTQESIDLGLETLQKMANLITDDATVEAQTHRDHLTLKITGGNAGILIGRKGQTLDAMQFLTDKIINRKSEARVRVKVDVEGYIETRKSNLRHLAIKMAEKAKKTGKPATINQMSAQDRRIVHLALKDDNRVRTQSMGDGYYRRLVIFPKKKNSFAGKKRFKR